jgi:hypothetical protein
MLNALLDLPTPHAARGLLALAERELLAHLPAYPARRPGDRQAACRDLSVAKRRSTAAPPLRV